MRVTNLGFAMLGVVCPVVVGVYVAACGSSPGDAGGGDGGVGGGDGASRDGTVFGQDAGGGGHDAGTAMGTFTGPDCPGCTFPPKGATACAPSAPPIQVVYPADGVLVPPNMNVISVQWTPFGAAFSKFEVDFSNSITDVRIITKCASQTMDTGQPMPTPSGGCELDLDPNVWKVLSNANRGGDPVTITVRGTTDGMCASTSTNSTNMSFATDDVLGGIYYWKSTVSANGVGGQIWVKSFGDSTPEQLVTTNLMATCNGCHALSRDGLRMSIYSDDDDSDDEYGDVRGSLIDMTTKAAMGGGQGAGFSTFSPDHSNYVATNGRGNAPTNVFSLLNGVTGGGGTTITVGAAGDRPTHPDWSPDGKTVVFVKPTQVGSWDNGGRNDDSHVFGGSLYTVPYMGNQVFGAAASLLASAGENNYYPSYSPDGQFIMFNRAPKDGTVATIDGCTGTAPQRSCPNDSFSNPAARVMLLATTGGAPVDLEAANGSPAASPTPLSNSWPRWSPFLQQYKGNRLLWITFSSTRDYGLRVRNHKTGMYQCYPADSFEDPGSAHRQPFATACEQPQLWMAAIDLSAASTGKDPSHVGFWLPFQDIKTHNHTPQWTQSVVSMPPPDGGACIPSGGNCQTNPSACCAGSACSANGTCQTIIR